MRIYLALILCSFAFSGVSQVFWTEDFSAGSAARGTSAIGYPGSSGGTWTQTITGTEGGSANQWYVSGEECGNAVGTCGSGCTNGDASLHVSAIGGLCGTPDCGAAYDETFAANATDRRIESPNINSTGYASLTLDFGYIAAQGDDGFDVVYSCDGGSNWTTLATPAATQCCSCLDAFLCGFVGICCAPQTQQSCASGGQGYWTTFSMSLPACTENISNLKIGFRWANDGNGVGTGPSVAIDDISISYSTLLPVELSSFQVEAEMGVNTLRWETSSEYNNDYFLVEHRAADSDFRPIGKVKGHGTTSEKQSYSWEHINPELGDNFYRLKQVDINGNVEYSQILLTRTKLSEMNNLFVYPTPASSILNVQFLSEKESPVASILILDLFGRVVSEKLIDLEKGVNLFTEDLSNYRAGSYQIIVTCELSQSAARFVKL